MRATARMAAQLDVPWHCICVETPKLQRLPDATRQRVLRLAQARAGRGRRDRLPGRQRARGDHRQVRPRAQPVARRAGARHRRRKRPWRGTLTEAVGALGNDLDVIQIALPPRGREPEPRSVAGRGRVRHGPRLATLRHERARLRRRRSGRGPAARRLRAGEHRHAVPARGGARRRALRPRAGGAGRLPQRGRLRLPLRAAALLVQRLRRAVPADVRGDAGRRAGDRPAHRGAAVAGTRRHAARGTRRRALRDVARPVRRAAGRADRRDRRALRRTASSRRRPRCWWPTTPTGVQPPVPPPKLPAGIDTGGRPMGLRPRRARRPGHRTPCRPRPSCTCR